MEIKEFVQNFAEQFDDIDTSDFSAETEFKDNDEWSSLTALSIIAMVDEVYNVKITGDDIRSSETIEDIYEKVKAKL
jgi:acyl carrier protein